MTAMLFSAVSMYYPKQSIYQLYLHSILDNVILRKHPPTPFSSFHSTEPFIKEIFRKCFFYARACSILTGHAQSILSYLPLNFTVLLNMSYNKNWLKLQQFHQGMRTYCRFILIVDIILFIIMLLLFMQKKSAEL